MGNMKHSIPHRLYNTLQELPEGAVFSAGDFSGLGPRTAIDVTLHRLAGENKIRRLIRGLYYMPQRSELLGRELTPEIDTIAHALARKFHWRIQPSGAMAQNLLGLSTQVPAKAFYISDGPNRRYQIGKTELMFKHSALKNSGFKYRESGLIVQALKSYGPKRVTEGIVKAIRTWLRPEIRKKVLRDTRHATGWIYTAIQTIAKEAHE